MNFFKKTNDDRYDETYSTPEFESVKEPEEYVPAPAPEKPAASFGGVNLGGNNIELKVVRPERFESVSQIADHLLKNRTVVLNLEATTKDVARRLIDFLSGVAYSIDGQLKRVANNTYIITPNNVDVSEAGIRGERREAPVEEAHAPVEATVPSYEEDNLAGELEY